MGTGSIESAVASLHVGLVFVLRTVTFHVIVQTGVDASIGLAIILGTTTVVEPVLFVGTSKTRRRWACRMITRCRTRARGRTFLVNMVCFFASSVLIGLLLVALTLVITTSAVLVITVVTAIIVAIAMVPTIITTITITATATRALATTVVVLVSGLEMGRRFLLFIVTEEREST
jgi:hypothetical protein